MSCALWEATVRCGKGHPRISKTGSCSLSLIRSREIQVLYKRFLGRSTRAEQVYAVFFCCLTFAHLARCAAAILRRADADIVRLPGFRPFAIGTTFCCPLTFDHRAL